MAPARRSLAFGTTAIALGALTVSAASRLSVAQERPYDLAFVPTPSATRWASAGHPTLVANLWWLRAVQYMGEPRADERGWERLFPAVDLVTDLDPRHGYAYQVAGNVLGSARRVEESNLLLEKGYRNVPDRYILPFHRAVNAFLYEGDYALAGEWFEKASRVPGAPPRVRDYAIAMYVKGRAAETAISFLGHLYTQAEDPESRKAIRKQLDRAILERDAAMLEDAVRRYAQVRGTPPVALSQLVLEGFVAAIPRDPFGGEYVLDASGRVVSTANPDRYARPLTEREREGRLRAVDRQVETLRQKELSGP
ncbi:MAG TPA: tetratricopeptide repeat protein [Anaeromyxobacter sp.]|nr:tetratricopeptide repeat protein [Anaeromyxobacter sp.]